MSEQFDRLLTDEHISRDELQQRRFTIINLIGSRAVQTHLDFEELRHE